MPDTIDYDETPARMPVAAALQVLVARRHDDEIVVTNQASARLWPTISDHALDFNYNPSTMGGAIPFGLGLALAQPDRQVTVLSGDGSLLMSLGSLVTVSGSGATNISIVVLDNGVYEVTGGQKTAAALAEVDYAGLGRAAGFPNVAHFWNLADWQRRVEVVLRARGPRLICLEVGRTDRQVLSAGSPSLAPRIDRFKQALSNTR